MPKKLALVSVSDKTNVERIAAALDAADYQIVSTGGTARYLREHGIEVADVSSVTGHPEVLDGRVKSLHPKIHAGILARRDVAAHLDELGEHEILPIDFVVTTLYPFRETIARPDVTLEDALENIDIGGPCMVRAAAKNFPAVAVVTDPDDYERVIAAVQGDGLDLPTRRDLALKAFRHTAAYDSAITEYLAGDGVALNLVAERSLRYGENPHQAATVYAVEGAQALGGYLQLHGKELSYNNLIDLDAACAIVDEFDTPGAAVIKHTNPAGCATGADALDAFEKALACDPVSAFGGIIVVNRTATKALAEKIGEAFYEVVCAPHFDDDALAVLTAKKNIRILQAPRTPQLPTQSLRATRFGWIGQDADPLVQLDRAELDVPTERQPTDEEWDALVFAWKVCKHVKSNAIVLARGTQTIGVGAGQMSRVDAVELAVKKAGGEAPGAVLASDAFFPFRDGPDAAAAAGVTAIIQPGGSRRDDEVIAACNEHRIAMVFTGRRHFRH